MESVLKHQRADDITTRGPACYRLSDHAERCEQSVIDFDSLSHGLAHGECAPDHVGRRPHAVLMANARQKILQKSRSGEEGLPPLRAGLRKISEQGKEGVFALFGPGDFSGILLLVSVAP